MRQFTTLVFTTAAVFISSVATANGKPAPGRYQLDPMHSKIGFEIAHLVISSVEGTFKSFEGQIHIDENFAKSRVNTQVEVSSIDTGVVKRDEHLRSSDFFDAQKYPKMTFDSTSISGSPEAFKLEGDLTIRGVKKKVIFDGIFLGTVKDGYGNRKAAFKARAKVKRKDFGLVWNAMVEAGPTVGDEVNIELNLQATAQQEQAKK